MSSPTMKATGDIWAAIALEDQRENIELERIARSVVEEFLDARTNVLGDPIDEETPHPMLVRPSQNLRQCYNADTPAVWPPVQNPINEVPGIPSNANPPSHTIKSKNHTVSEVPVASRLYRIPKSTMRVLFDQDEETGHPQGAHWPPILFDMDESNFNPFADEISFSPLWSSSSGSPSDTLASFTFDSTSISGLTSPATSLESDSELPSDSQAQCSLALDSGFNVNDFECVSLSNASTTTPFTRVACTSNVLAAQHLARVIQWQQTPNESANHLATAIQSWSCPMLPSTSGLWPLSSVWSTVLRAAAPGSSSLLPHPATILIAFYSNIPTATSLGQVAQVNSKHGMPMADIPGVHAPRPRFPKEDLRAVRAAFERTVTESPCSSEFIPRNYTHDMGKFARLHVEVTLWSISREQRKLEGLPPPVPPLMPSGLGMAASSSNETQDAELGDLGGEDIEDQLAVLGFLDVDSLEAADDECLGEGAFESFL